MTEEEPEIEEDMEEEFTPPDNWEDIPIDQMVKDGWRPRRHVVQGREYLTLRFGNQEKSLGRYSEAKYDFLLKKYPALRQGRRPVPKEDLKGGSLLKTRVGKATTIPKSVYPSLTVLRYYELLKSNGFPGDFTEFMNDVIETHFSKCHNLLLPVVIRKAG